MADVIDTETKEKLSCVLRGKFKMQKIRPIVGDFVEYTTDESDTGKIENILERKNILYRPSIANIDQIILVTTLKSPCVDNLIIDKFLIQAEKENMDVIIVVNKTDLLITQEEKLILENFRAIYEDMYTVIPVCSKTGENIDKLKIFLKDKISTMAGMSGVGKSSLLNFVNPGLKLKVGDISDRLQRGKHTTTYSELMQFDFGGFIADTPGFANMELINFNADKLKNFFPEFSYFGAYCAFSDCSHIHEPNCAVKDAVENDQISLSRYNNYKKIYSDLKTRNSGGKKYD